MDSSVVELQKFVQASHLIKDKNITLKDLGRLDKSSVAKETEIIKAAKLLSSQNRSGLPVIDDQEKVIGFLSEKDCLKHLYERRTFQVEQGTVGEIMKTSVMCLDENASIYHVIDMFIKHPYHVYPVIDVTGVYVGLVRRSDVFKFLV